MAEFFHGAKKVRYRIEAQCPFPELTSGGDYCRKLPWAAFRAE
jgi:hypothetical protein